MPMEARGFNGKLLDRRHGWFHITIKLKRPFIILCFLPFIDPDVYGTMNKGSK